MKIVFFGTPSYTLPILTSLHKNFKGKDTKSPIVAVVTQPPKPSGRGKFLTYSPIDDWAHKRGIPKFFKPKDLLIGNLEFDLGVLASFGMIIPKEVLDAFPLGIINVHPSLLPEFRGSSPVQAAIISGDTKTGGTIIKLDEKLDHGPILGSFKEDINETDTSETLRDRIFDKSKDVLEDLIPAYVNGKIKPKAQDEENAIYTKEIVSQDGFINPTHLDKLINGKSFKETLPLRFIEGFEMDINPESLERFIRAMNPWPCAWTEVNISDTKKRLKILSSHTQGGKLIPDMVQLEGKNEVTFKQFEEGYPNYKFL